MTITLDGILALLCSRCLRRCWSSIFDADIDFLNPPNDLYLGEVTGVTVNSKKQIFVV